jgi:hypothetical protein
MWSTEEDGGQLVLDWEFDEKKIQTYEIFCAGGDCLYSTLNPAFLAHRGEPPTPDLHPLTAGTEVSVQIIAMEETSRVLVNGERLDAESLAEGNDEVVLGTMEQDLHVHPTWQISVPEEEFGDYPISLRVKAPPRYEDSIVYSTLMTNVPPPVTPTPAGNGPCVGDCNEDGTVSVGEVIRGVAMALRGSDTEECPAFDPGMDGAVEVSELVQSVAAAVNGCIPVITEPTLEAIQGTIFTKSCVALFCHDSATAAGRLTLEEGQSFEALVGVIPDNPAAEATGLLRVDPGRPDNSFLVVKLEGVPSSDFGTDMPAAGNALAPQQIQLIRDWISEGANP